MFVAFLGVMIKGENVLGVIIVVVVVTDFTALMMLIVVVTVTESVIG